MTIQAPLWKVYGCLRKGGGWRWNQPFFSLARSARPADTPPSPPRPLRMFLPEAPAVAPMSYDLASQDSVSTTCRPGAPEALLLCCGQPAAWSLPLGATLPVEAEICLVVFSGSQKLCRGSSPACDPVTERRVRRVSSSLP